MLLGAARLPGRWLGGRVHSSLVEGCQQQVEMSQDSEELGVRATPLDFGTEGQTWCTGVCLPSNELLYSLSIIRVLEYVSTRCKTFLEIPLDVPELATLRATLDGGKPKLVTLLT